MLNATGLEGGSGRIPAQGVAKPLSFISLIPLWLSNNTRPARAAREKRRGRERPPPKPGGHVTLDSGTEWHTAIRPMRGRSRPHLSLREGLEQPPGGGAERRDTDL